MTPAQKQRRKQLHKLLNPPRQKADPKQVAALKALRAKIKAEDALWAAREEKTSC